MHWSEICREWDRMRSVVRTQWQELSDDELALVDGDRGKLIEALQRCYGLTAENAEEAVCAFEKNLRRPGSVE